MQQPLEIVILGGGTAGWMTAAGLASRIPQERCRVRLVESDEIGIVGVGEATLPLIKNFNDSIGIDEAEMMRATNATFKLGIDFIDWGYKGSRYIHPFGVHGSANAGLGFHQEWLRAKRAGRDWDIQEFSFACMAARHNRFDFPAVGARTINSTLSYAYHFDASLYAKFLRSQAEPRGVQRIEGKVRDVEQDPETGDIRALIMESGERIAGDFFIDCSGFRSLLLAGRLGAEWEDWSQWLACDRALPVPTERQGDLTPYTRVIAMDAGWRWRIPLQHRTGNGYVFSSRFIDEDKAREELLDSLDEKTLAEPRLLKFKAGRRTRSWIRNCVAIGLASGFLEPLESTSIYLIQVAIMNLLPLLPTKRYDERLVDEFNTKIDLEYERIRDFLILHYHATDREDTEFWRYCKSMEVPESLERKMRLFRHSGVVPQYREGLFTPPSWISVFFGQGVTPEHYNPLADAMPIDRLLQTMDELREDIRDRVDEMPKHASLLARYADAGTAPATVVAESREGL
ncbi:MAG: tryptophan halogenase family protein [Bacillota bacterium]